jgi:HSP20 family protein
MSSRSLSPLESIVNLRGALDEFFDQAQRPAPGFAGAGVAQLPLNVYDSNDELHIEALLPGIAQDDIRLDIDRGVLTIAAQRQAPDEGEQRWYLSEFGAGEFARSLRLPYPVDQERTTAQFTNGVLRLTLPKAESAKPRRIAIGGGQQAQIAGGRAAD